MRLETELTRDHLLLPFRVEASEGGVEVIERLADRWRRLCAEGPADEPFFRPEWIAAFARAFLPDKPVLVITAWRGDELKAVLPLVKEATFWGGIPARTLRGPANAHSCRFDLVRGAGPQGAKAVVAIWNYLKALSWWDVIELPDVPQGGGAELILSAAEGDGFHTGRQATLQSPYLRLPGRREDDHAWRSNTDAKFRGNLRRRSRRLAARGPVRLRRVEEADPTALRRLYELEASGWKGHAGSAIACRDRTRKFYDEIAREAARYGCLSLYFLECNGRPIACHFGLTCAGRYFLVKPGYDESYKDCAPGHLLVEAVVTDCAGRGLREFDFCGPRMDWKMEWTSAVRPHANVYVFGRGIVGRLLHAARFRAKAIVKRVLQQC